MNSVLELFQATGIGLLLILPLANPLTTVALFLGLSGNMGRVERHKQSMMASIYVFIIMMVAFYGGQLVMSTFGISIPGLRIAGGLIVAFIGFKMLFPQESDTDTPEVDDKLQDVSKRKTPNIAFVPLAMPSTAGPGTIAMIISGASSIENNPYHFSGWVLAVAPVVVFATVAIILWLCLLSSGAIMKLVGKGGIAAISRLMGFLLVCMGVQFVINGVLEIITNYGNGLTG
ncbi:UPF0056 inner membrane protein [Salmonella enterica subsp. enterica serovar Choleraesuis]|nr:UPF0056 inner membrane protein [Salmonella enterica subsp. enterica serovar Choleraesuis]